MWHYKYIDTQLRFRLNALADIVIEERLHTGGNFTQIYKYNGVKILVYNRKKNGMLTGNFVISSFIIKDPKKAIEFQGRRNPGTWGKRLVISKCGDNDIEKFNYISELLYQVILSLE
jgi:hypothetical protein